MLLYKIAAATILVLKQLEKTNVAVDNNNKLLHKVLRKLDSGAAIDKPVLRSDSRVLSEDFGLPLTDLNQLTLLYARLSDVKNFGKLVSL